MMMKKKTIKFLELFSGSGKISKILSSSFGFRCTTIDYEMSYHPNICCNVYDLDIGFFKQFDFIWLSPDCTTYSKAQHGLHRLKGGLPVSEYAKYCDLHNSILFATLIKSGIPFIAENPLGHMRQMSFVKDLHIKTIYYSNFGSRVCKPTDLFSNYFELLFPLDGSYKKGTISLDKIPWSNFLGRCDIPNDLILAIGSSIVSFFS